MTNKIKVVQDEDLEKFLESIMVLDGIKSGKINCKICGIKITIKNLQAVYSKESKIYFICDKPHCIKYLQDE